jgi:hypothetical protein
LNELENRILLDDVIREKKVTVGRIRWEIPRNSTPKKKTCARENFCITLTRSSEIEVNLQRSRVDSGLRLIEILRLRRSIQRRFYS